MPIALPINDLADAMRAEHTEAVEQLCRTARRAARAHARPPRRHARVADGADGATARRRRRVMGAISRSGFKGLFLGNTAEDVLDRLHCDLIIVKPEGFKAALPS